MAQLLTDEKQIIYLKEILDDAIMLARFKILLNSSKNIETAIWYTQRDRDTDRAIHYAKQDGIIPQ